MSRSTSNLLSHYESLPGSARIIYPQMVKSPMSNTIFKNKQGFILNSKLIKFDTDSWKHNPQLFCKDYYNDQYLYQVILICNDLGSIYEFTKDNLNKGIITPHKSIIYKILNQIKNTEEDYE